MRRKLILIFLFVFAVKLHIFAANEISDNRAILLLNYLQYSLLQIENNPNQLVAEHEFSTIINRINPSSLNNDEIIDAYQDFLDSTSELKILDKQKENAEKIAQIERQQALVNSLSGFNPQFFIGDPTAIILNIAFSGVNVGLNYKKFTSQIDLDLVKEKFKIEDLQIRRIDKCRSNLWTTSSKVFKDKSETNFIISEEIMKDFVATINLNDVITIEKRLIDLKISLSIFPLYWFALGYSQQCNGKINEALDSYSHYEELIKKEPIFKLDEIYCQLLLAKIDIYNSQNLKNHTFIENCFNELNSQLDFAPFDVKSQIAYGIALAYFKLKDFSNAKKFIDKIIGWKSGNWSDTANVLNDVLEQELNGGFKTLNVSFTQKPEFVEDAIVEENETFDNSKILKIIIIALIIFTLRGWIFKLFMTLSKLIKKGFLVLIKKDDNEESFIDIVEEPPHLYTCLFCHDTKKGWKRPHAGYPCSSRYKGNPCKWIKIY